MLTSKMIKEAALAAGADACGIAPMSRFDGAPDEMNPQKLFPEAKSCIGFVFRIPRAFNAASKKEPSFFSIHPWHTAASTKFLHRLFYTRLEK